MKVCITKTGNDSAAYAALAALADQEEEREKMSNTVSQPRPLRAATIAIMAENNARHLSKDFLMTSGKCLGDATRADIFAEINLLTEIANTMKDDGRPLRQQPKARKFAEQRIITRALGR